LLFGAVFSSILLSSCGYPGDPLPPLANVPGQIKDLDAVQRGGRLIVHFTVPERTTEGIAIKTPLRLELQIDDRSIPSPPSVRDFAEYEIPTADWTGKTVAINARAIGSNGKAGGWSSTLNLPIVPPPETPAALKAEPRPDGVGLSWQGAAGDFVVLRRSGDEKDFAQAAQVQQEQWVDHAAEFGKPYVYMVQRIVKLEGGRTAQSELSSEVRITPSDTFPPSAPGGLLAVAAPKSVELTWEANTESDLASYRVYRATGEGAFEKAADGLQTPGWSDRAVESGKTYRYAVTAIDQAGNESARSPVVQAIVE
jgi:fibronectin type 3 domain-containing protein